MRQHDAGCPVRTIIVSVAFLAIVVFQAALIRDLHQQVADDAYQLDQETGRLHSVTDTLEACNASLNHGTEVMKQASLQLQRDTDRMLWCAKELGKR